MLPFIIGGAIVAGIVGTISNVEEGEKMTASANRQSTDALNKAYAEEARANQKKEKSKIAMLRLANRKKAVLKTTIPAFLELYDKLIKINIVESNGIKELSSFPTLAAEEMRAEVKATGYIMTDSEAVSYLVGMGASGFLTLAVGAGIEAAGTASVIGSAALAGGSVGIAAGASVVGTAALGGALALAGPALIASAATLPFVASLAIKKEGEEKLKEAAQIEKQARLQKSHYANISLSYSAIEERCAKMTNVLTKLNVMFKKSIDHCSEITAKNGADKCLYSENERTSLAGCLNLAKAVKAILDVPLLDENGKITKASLEAIETGNQYILKISNL